MNLTHLARRATTFRRWPWLTLLLTMTNLSLFVVFGHVDRAREQRLALRGLTALVYFQQHPYLSLKSPLDQFVERNRGADLGEFTHVPSLADLSSLPLRPKTTTATPDHVLLRQEQAELDVKVSAFAQVAAEWNTASLGYVPRARNGWGLITYQFMHASWLHLLGNFVFLWLVGPKLERTWGRVAFSLFYVTSGIAAAGAHHVLASQSTVPLIGASGAIAGLLGAFTLRHWRTAMQPTIAHGVHGLAWRARLHLLLLTWFALELAQVVLWPARDGSAAHVAHVGGFLFGVIAAWTLRAAGFERCATGHYARPVRLAGE